MNSEAKQCLAQGITLLYSFPSTLGPRDHLAVLLPLTMLGPRDHLAVLLPFNAGPKGSSCCTPSLNNAGPKGSPSVLLPLTMLGPRDHLAVLLPLTMLGPCCNPSLDSITLSLKNRHEGDPYAEITKGNSCGAKFLTARNILPLRKLLNAFVKSKKCTIRSLTFT